MYIILHVSFLSSYPQIYSTIAKYEVGQGPVVCVFIWAWLISGAVEASKPDNDIFTFELFYVVSSFLNPLNY